MEFSEIYGDCRETEEDDLSQEDCDEIVEFLEARELYRDDMDEETVEALCTDPRDWTARQLELVEAARHPEFHPQVIYDMDPDTGQALEDENGEYVTLDYRKSGSQAPDLSYRDGEGVMHLREDKAYTDKYALMHNIRDQTEDRVRAFGKENLDLVYGVAAKDLTVADADYIQKSCHKLGVEADFVY